MFVPKITSTIWFYHCTLEMSTVTWTQWAFSSKNEGESNEQNLISCIKSDKLCKQRFNENLAMSKTAWRAVEETFPKILEPKLHKKRVCASCLHLACMWLCIQAYAAAVAIVQCFRVIFVGWFIVRMKN